MGKRIVGKRLLMDIYYHEIGSIIGYVVSAAVFAYSFYLSWKCTGDQGLILIKRILWGLSAGSFGIFYLLYRALLRIHFGKGICSCFVVKGKYTAVQTE